MDAICMQMENLSINNISNDLFKFLFQWNPNISINNRPDMTEVWFNSNHYLSFQHAIIVFNAKCNTHTIEYYCKQNTESFYDCVIQLRFNEKRKI